MARRFRRASGNRGPKNNVWTVLVFDDQVISTSVIEGVIVATNDWQPSSSGFEHATLLRIRGWLSLSRNEANDGVGTMYMLIYVTDANAGVVNPSLATTYVNEDVIWTAGVTFSSQQAASLEANPIVQVDVDVKAMRKINSAQQVRIALVSTSTGLVVVGGILRALIRKS